MNSLMNKSLIADGRKWSCGSCVSLSCRLTTYHHVDAPSASPAAVDTALHTDHMQCSVGKTRGAPPVFQYHHDSSCRLRPQTGGLLSLSCSAAECSTAYCTILHCETLQTLLTSFLTCQFPLQTLFFHFSYSMDAQSCGDMGHKYL